MASNVKGRSRRAIRNAIRNAPRCCTIAEDLRSASVTVKK